MARYAANPIDQERVLAGVLADVLGIEDLPVGSHFFDDLGAHSMVMARFCARVRKRPDLPSVSMKDVYFVHAAQRACNAHSDFWFKRST